jgi:HK97 family phage prohead protease
MTKEYKSFQSFETKIDSDLGIVESIVAVMGNVDYGRDVIHPGAFTKTISERRNKIKVLDMHNSDSVMRIIGKPVEMREIPKAQLPQELLKEYPDATGGLWCKTQFLIDTPEGKGAFERIKSGALQEWSIGYDVLDSDFSKVKTKDGEVTVRNLRTIKLYEYSAVIWGMNPATATVDAKKENEMEKEEVINEEVKEETKPEIKNEDKGKMPKYLSTSLQAAVFGGINNILSGWLNCNHITYDEMIALNNAVINSVNTLTAGIPAELATREVGYQYSYDYYDALNPDLESKAGRVLSSRNLTALQNAIEKLQEVLKAAMPMEDDDDMMDEEEDVP